MNDASARAVACSIDGCERPKYSKKRGLCCAHNAKFLRHGDPLWTAPPRFADITGQRFGMLTALERVENEAAWSTMWRCRCDCGDTLVAPIANLRRGATSNCGGKHRRLPIVGYKTAHDRVTTDRGRAGDHACVDCGATADHWSYDHSDPDELAESIVGRGGRPQEAAFSLDPWHYDPRCRGCHQSFDQRIARRRRSA